MNRILTQNLLSENYSLVKGTKINPMVWMYFMTLNSQRIKKKKSYDVKIFNSWMKNTIFMRHHAILNESSKVLIHGCPYLNHKKKKSYLSYLDIIDPIYMIRF